MDHEWEVMKNLKECIMGRIVGIQFVKSIFLHVNWKEIKES